MNVDGLINNIILYYFGGLKNKIIIQAQKNEDTYVVDAFTALCIL